MARLTQRLGLTRYEADEYYKKALDAYHKNQLEEALVNVTEAISLLPRNSEYYAARGFFYLEDGVRDKAYDDFEAALRLHPYEMLAHYGRGIMAYNDRNWDEALAHFKDALIANPKRPETLYYLALTHHRRDNQEQALQYMEQALAAFEEVNDRRRADARRWVRELSRILERQQEEKLAAVRRPLAPARQQQLPLSVADDDEDEDDQD
jgi:tetratricopeptide (TPR) repeat protein